jgi:hypothetical protein
MRQFAVLLLIAFSVAGSPLVAQVDDFGSLDSVIVGHATVSPGSKFSISVTLVNDESLAAFAIPLIYAKDKLVFDSASFAGSLAKDWEFQTAVHDADAATILIGAVSLGDSPILPGRGNLTELYFHVQSNIAADVTTLIDSVFVPPAGRLELNTVTAGVIRPGFQAGSVLIGASNRPPVFDPISARTVNEGDPVSLAIRASDPERAPLKLHASRLCPGASFTDNGNGTGVFKWQVPFTGPGSSIGSPFSLVIVATDGEKNSSLEIAFDVINRNRVPAITAGEGVSAGAGDTLFVPFAATDPDFEDITFGASGLPSGAELSTGNPGYLRWISDISDSGDYTFTLQATDEAGGTANRQVNFQLLPNMPMELTISDEQAYSGELVTIVLSAHNRVPISGFEVLLGYDRSLLTYLSAVKTLTRVESWLQFNVTNTPDGKIAISAKANPANPAANPLPVGSGEIARVTFRISSDLSFAGFYSSVQFAYLNPGSDAENVAYGADGAFISRTQTLYEEGGVLVKRYAGLIGDINLNGVALEIGDVVYFTNSFINPSKYPLTGERLQNSDVNQDGIPATLADLIRLIQLFTNGGAKITGTDSSDPVRYQITSTDRGWSYGLDAPVRVAAALYTLRVDGDAAHNFVVSPSLSDFEVVTYQDGDLLRVLIHNSDGRGIDLGPGDLFTLNGDVALVSQQYVNQSGHEISATLSRNIVLPSDFELFQNYPNPFNPETTISFDLPVSGAVKLEMFNILGESVATPIEGSLAAGRHTVTFRGAKANGEELPSGVYFYRLRAERFESTRKMILLK